MGISGLLPQLKSVTVKAHVSKYRGQRAAVDAYVLLHRGAYTCAREICEGQPSDRCTEYCMGRIQLLMGAGVVPVVVFDGGRLPNKDEEEKSRARSREENKAKARALWQQGNKTAAFECYSKAVDITPAVAKGFIDALKAKGVEFIVAPYEADAQMAYLALNGQVDVVITEDSDLLTYGCPRVFFKMDKSGDGEEIELRNLPHARELSFLGFTHDMFQEMCILAGCDFVKALPGIGIKKAHQQIRQRRSFLKVVRNLRFSGTQVPQDYEKRVQRAIWTFQHQRVFCPQRRAVVHLREVQGSLGEAALVPAAAELVDGEEDFLGPALPDEIAQGIAAGELDPITKLPYGIGPDGLPCTAPQEQDDPAPGSQGSGGGKRSEVQASLWQLMAGLDKPPGRQQQQKERGKAGGGNNGTTLANYGFLRNSDSVQKEFKRPRMSREAGGGPRQQAVQQQGQAAVAAAAAAVASPSRQRQAFLEKLQAADSQPQFSMFAAGSRGQPAAAAAAAAPRMGAAGLLAKLRCDLRGPVQQQPSAAEEGAAVHARTPLGLPASPTLDELLTGGREVIPESPEVSTGAGAPVERCPAWAVPGGGGCSGAGAPSHQITPGFYGSPGPVEGEEGALEGEEGQGAAGPTPGSDAISSLDHVSRFAKEAKAAVDRVFEAQAARAAAPVPLRIQPPPYLQQQQRHQQGGAAAAAVAAVLKRPFCVPRKAGTDKENSAVEGSKKQRQGGASNLFSKFSFK